MNALNAGGTKRCVQDAKFASWSAAVGAAMGLALLVADCGHAATTIIAPDGGAAEARDSETTRAAIAGDYLYRLRGAFSSRRSVSCAVRGFRSAR